MMKKRVGNYNLRLQAVVLLSYSLFACANIGNPNGGPYDEKPPQYVSSKPAMNQLNFKGNKIEIWFDEYISIDNPSENVIVTPPQTQAPIIQAVGKKITVELRDTLLEETTYTIDFTSSIVDNNEKNALENFSFAFSTGDVLDTLQISGIVINAEDLEPVQKMLVGIHRDLSDTAFTKTPFLRTSKTDERGRFNIKNIAPGAYRVFALEDKNRNYAYDKNNNEGLAFLDTIVEPYCERATVADTIWKDSITVDTVMMVERTLFYPNDLVLWFFKDSIPPRQRMLRPERSKEHIITLKFNAPMDTFPKPVPLNFEPADTMWYVTQKGEDPESFAINYWILDSMIYKKDTLQVEVSYWRNNDTIPDLLELQTDTLNIPYKAVQTKTRDNRSRLPRRPPGTPSDTTLTEPEHPPVIPLQMNISPSGSLNPYDFITVIVNEPVLDVRKEHFVMEIGVDTLWQEVDFDFEIDSTRAMTYLLKRQFNYEESYRLTIDSAMLTSVYGHPNNPTTAQMTVKGKKEYGNLIINIHGLPFMGNGGEVLPETVDSVEALPASQELPETVDSLEVSPEYQEPPIAGDSVEVHQELTLAGDSVEVSSASQELTLNESGKVMPAFVELLNSAGAPVRKAIVENGVATFMDLNVDKYYARIIFDTNRNGSWDAGNYEEKRQPERVFYFMIQFETRQNFVFEEDWDVSKSAIGQKPDDLIKNKPKDQTKIKRDYREESKPRNRNSTSTNMGGLRF